MITTIINKSPKYPGSRNTMWEAVVTPDAMQQIHQRRRILQRARTPKQTDDVTVAQKYSANTAYVTHKK
jgi:hypothetical protein